MPSRISSSGHHCPMTVVPPNIGAKIDEKIPKRIALVTSSQRPPRIVSHFHSNSPVKMVPMPTKPGISVHT